MSKGRERELRFAAVWQEMLKKEAEWNAHCLEGGFIKIPPMQAITNCFNVTNDPMPVTIFERTESLKMLDFLWKNGYITVWQGGDRGGPKKGFSINKRDPLPVSPEKEKRPAKPIIVPSITKDEVRQIVELSCERLVAQLAAKLDQQIPELRALVSSRVRGQPNIVVLFDTANFGKGCDVIGIKMPLESLFAELAKIGNIISSWAFCNMNCPDYVLRVLTAHSCNLILCLDNKKPEPETKIEGAEGKTTIINKPKTDWIDERISRFITKSLNWWDYDIAVFVSSDTHFYISQNDIKQTSRQVMRCTVDEQKKQVYLWNEKGLVATLRTERR